MSMNIKLVGSDAAKMLTDLDRGGVAYSFTRFNAESLGTIVLQMNDEAGNEPLRIVLKPDGTWSATADVVFES